MWGEEISASSSRVERLEELDSRFGVEGKVEPPELDSPSESGSGVVRIVDRD